MKKLLILSLASLVSLASLSDDVIAQTLLSDGSTNTWTQADLLAALQLINRKYHRETDQATGTSSGRAAWHGKVVHTVVDVTNETRTTTHEDGKVFVDHFVPRPPAVTPAKLPKRAMTNGVPVALAAARQRQIENEATTNIVTVTLAPTP